MKLIDVDKIELDYSGLIHLSPYDFIGTAKYFADQIKSEPTVDAEPIRHGEWDGWGYCSYCGLPWDYLMTQNAEDDGFFDPMPPYCPNCGAKMDL